MAGAEQRMQLPVCHHNLVRLTFDQAFTSLCAKGLAEELARLAAIDIAAAFTSRKLKAVLTPDVIVEIIGKPRS